MSKRLGFAAALAVAAIVAFGPGLAAAQDHKVVLVRQAVMKHNAAAARAIGAYLKEGKGDPAELEAQVLAVAGIAGELPYLFPKGTDRGMLGDKATRAKPEIWAKWDDFKSDATNLGTKARELASALRSGEKPKIQAAFGDMGKNACGACHQAFRGPEVK